MQTNRWLQTLIVLLVVIASLFLAGLVWSFLNQFSSIILLFFLSWLLAFVLRPVARWLTAHGIPYTFSVLVVYVVLALVFVVGGLLLVPVITQQISQLINNFNGYVNDLAAIVDQGQKLLISWGVRDVDITRFYNDLAGQVQTISMTVLQNTFSVLQSVATLALQLILVLFLSFYFMKDGDRIFGGMLQLLPPTWQDEARLLALSIEKSFGAFVRGQVLFALAYAVLNAAVMFGFGLDYVVLASIVAGLCMVIPLIGNFLAFAPPMLVCLVTKPDSWAWVLLALFVMQSFTMQFIGPRIMSQAIGIHPLYVVGAMLVGGQVAGFWGALFGIPMAGAMNLIGRPMMRRIRHQVPLYQEVQSAHHLTTRSFVTGPLKAAVAEQADKERAASQRSEAAAAARAQIPARTEPVRIDLDYDLDVPSPRPPTITARVWALAWLMVSRAYSWVGARAHARSSRN
jgi:predicted PurR-regulated permease PerM